MFNSIFYIIRNNYNIQCLQGALNSFKYTKLSLFQSKLIDILWTSRHGKKIT